MGPSSATSNRGEICKTWKDVMTALAEFRGGFTIFLKYLGGHTVSGTLLRGPSEYSESVAS